MKFKIGDKVRREYLPYRGSDKGVGEVIDIGPVGIRVEWENDGAYWVSPEILKLVETPIERMKRRYEEEE